MSIKAAWLLAPAFVFLLLLSSRVYAASTTPPTFLKTIPDSGLNLYLPRGIEYNASNEKTYIVDSGNNTVLMLGTEGDIEAAWNDSFDSPTDIAIDSGGNLYVTDTGNNKIKKFSDTGYTDLGEWGTAGTGAGQFDSPKGIAVDEIGGIWVVDSGNNRIEYFDSNGNYLTKFGTSGTGDGEFDNPTGIDIDSSGNIYIVDTGNNRVQVFNSSLTHVRNIGSSGTGDGKFDQPDSVKVNDMGQIFVSDYGNNRMEEFQASDGAFVTPAWGSLGDSDGEFNGPRGVAWNGGSILVIDSVNGRFQKFAGDTHDFQDTSIGASDDNGRFNYPTGFGLTKNGDLHIYVADTLNNRIEEIDGQGGAYITKWGSSGTDAGKFNAPVGAGVDTDGNVYVVDRDNNRIQKFESDGTFVASWSGDGTEGGQFNQPNGIFVTDTNFVFVVDTNKDRFLEFDKEGTFINSWGTSGTGPGEFNKPMGIAVDQDGNIFLTDSLNNRVQKFSSDGTFLLQFGSSGDGDGEFNNPLGIAIDSNQNIYVADKDNYRIQKFDSTGAYLTQWGSNGPTDGYYGTMGSDNADFNHGPFHMAFDGEGRLYVADPVNNRLQVYSAESSSESDGINADSRCHWSTPPETTWIRLSPATENGKSGMNLTWTQYTADKIDIKIDNGTGNFPWKISETSNDGHEFLQNVAGWQKIMIKPINHCKEGSYGQAVSSDKYPYGWYNIK